MNEIVKNPAANLGSEMEIHTVMNRVLFTLFCVFVGNIAFADVEYAYVVKAKDVSIYERCGVDKKDYAKAFEGIDVRVDGDDTEDGVFGVPAYMVVQADNKCYLLIINNTHGVISVYPVRKKGNQWIGKSGGGGRSIYLPSLYDKLKAMGLKVLTEEELSDMYRRKHKQNSAPALGAVLILSLT